MLCGASPETEGTNGGAQRSSSRCFFAQQLPLAIGVLWVGRRTLLCVGRLWGLFWRFCLGFSVYLYLPAATLEQPYVSWGDGTTLQASSSFQLPRARNERASRRCLISAPALSRCACVSRPPGGLTAVTLLQADICASGPRAGHRLRKGTPAGPHWIAAGRVARSAAARIRPRR